MELGLAVNVIECGQREHLIFIIVITNMTFNEQWEIKFGQEFPDADGYEVNYDKNALKSHITSRQNSLIDEVVERAGEKKNVRTTSKVTPEQKLLAAVFGKPRPMTEDEARFYRRGLQDAIELLRSYKI